MQQLTANNQEISPSHSGNFQGLLDQIVPEFSDILLGLSDLLSTKNISLADNQPMFIIKNNSSLSKFIKDFKENIIHSVKFIAKVTDGILSFHFN